jgi:hypothetical protein
VPSAGARRYSDYERKKECQGHNNWNHSPKHNGRDGFLYRDIIIKAARSFDDGILDVERNESWERLKILTVPQVMYMGKGTEGLQQVREDILAEHKGVMIPAEL